ncbi:amino acid ABC transporter permease [Sagittula sp. NFXS13]|uniref:amino acid ABC transporter permease n=1 Tax=Sagittula sp. NFXS13 TaxID=2819095 RepID=UPI0032DF878C
MNYNWDWGVLLEAPYWQMLQSGALWSFATAGPAWLLAYTLGITVAVLRTMEVPAARVIGIAYVEIFRNIPLLVQVFLWYFVLPELMPEQIGHFLKREFPAFLTAAIAIACYHGARIGEVVRGGIEGLGTGQRQAARALGLGELRIYYEVILPLALRNTIPPLTSECLAIFKHTSLALTIGVLEITARAREIEEFTFQGFEAFAAASLFYLVVTVAIMIASLAIEGRTRVHGLLSARGR